MNHPTTTNEYTMGDTFWFYLEPYVFASCKEGALLLFNTLNGTLLEYAEPEIVAFMAPLLTLDNMRVGAVGAQQLQREPLRSFVARLRREFMADVLPQSWSCGKPIQFTPQLSMQKTLPQAVEEGVKDLVFSLSLHITDHCDRDCRWCGGPYPGHRQFLCCRRAEGAPTHLPLPRIAALVEELRSGTVTRIQVLGGALFLHPDFRAIVALLESLPAVKTYFLHPYHAPLLAAMGDGFGAASRFRFVVDGGADLQPLADALDVARARGAGAVVDFVSSSPEDGENAERFIAVRPASPRLVYTFQPWFTGANLGFFREHVFTSREDLQAARPQFSEIFAKSQVNPLQFGTLTVLPDGAVHAHTLQPALGSLDRGGLYGMVREEVGRGGSWTLRRGDVAPCRSCNFELLCPPISSYEMVLGRYDLCHMHGVAPVGSMRG